MRIASWNIARGLSDADRTKNVYNGIDSLDADIVFLPEALDKSGQPIDPTFAENLGYAALATEYEDTHKHPSDKQYILALSRVAALLEITRLDTRNALRASFEIEGEDISVTGAHFDDREEDIRLDMVKAFLSEERSTSARVLIGDLNSMHGDDVRSRLLSSTLARSSAAKIKNDRARSLAIRLTDMASGNVMEELEGAGMKDADPLHRPTMLLGKLAIVQLDHLMHDDKLRVVSFSTKKLKGSDHKAISGDLELA